MDLGGWFLKDFNTRYDYASFVMPQIDSNYPRFERILVVGKVSPGIGGQSCAYSNDSLLVGQTVPKMHDNGRGYALATMIA